MTRRIEATVALIAGVVLGFPERPTATENVCPGPPSVPRCLFRPADCSVKERGVAAHGNCPVDPDAGNDRLLCCSMDNCGNKFQIWCVSNSANRQAGGGAGMYVGVYTPKDGTPRAVGACWFDNAKNERQIKCDAKGKFCSITWTNNDAADTNPTYDQWLYEYTPDNSGPNKPGELKRTGKKDDGTKDPDGVKTEPPTDFTKGLQCVIREGPFALGECPAFFDTTTDHGASFDSVLILAGDVCATAIPVQGPLNTQVDLSAFQDNYCLDACVPDGAAGAEMFYRVRLDGSPSNLTVSAQPLDSVDVAIVMFASCDSCIAGTNLSGPGGVEVLSTPGLPNGDYTVCIKSTGPGPGGPVQVSFSATADVPIPQPTRLGFRRLNEHPARHDARMRFELVHASRVSLSIHDASGRTLNVLTLEPLGPGIHDRVWDLRDDRGRRMAPGVYYARLEVDAEVASLPIVVVR